MFRDKGFWAYDDGCDASAARHHLCAPDRIFFLHCLEVYQKTPDFGECQYNLRSFQKSVSKLLGGLVHDYVSEAGVDGKRARETTRKREFEWVIRRQRGGRGTWVKSA